jgi:hypothetical protein
MDSAKVPFIVLPLLRREHHGTATAFARKIDGIAIDLSRISLLIGGTVATRDRYTEGDGIAVDFAFRDHIGAAPCVNGAGQRIAGLHEHERRGYRTPAARDVRGPLAADVRGRRNKGDAKKGQGGQKSCSLATKGITGGGIVTCLLQTFTA